jgi:hypothetical protein
VWGRRYQGQARRRAAGVVRILAPGTEGVLSPPGIGAARPDGSDVLAPARVRGVGQTRLETEVDGDVAGALTAGLHETKHEPRPIVVGEGIVGQVGWRAIRRRRGPGMVHTWVVPTR